MIAVLRGNTKRKFASLLQTKGYSSFMKAKAHEKDELHVSWCDDVHAMLSRSLNK